MTDEMEVLLDGPSRQWDWEQSDTDEESEEDADSSQSDADSTGYAEQEVIGFKVYNYCERHGSYTGDQCPDCEPNSADAPD